MRTYISGKITGLELEKVQAKFDGAASLIANIGMDPVNPMSWADQSKSWADMMKESISNLMDCDAILLLRDWTDSKGARIERYIAQQMNMTILNEIDVNQTVVMDVKDAIREVIGLDIDEYTTSRRFRPCYYARVLFVKYCVDVLFMLPEDLVNIVHRDRCTIHRYLKNFDDEVKYNKSFREIYYKVNEIISKTVSL
jgi:vacuolar-type H+-ATPase subunit F/Vma7